MHEKLYRLAVVIGIAVFVAALSFVAMASNSGP